MASREHELLFQLKASLDGSFSGSFSSAQSTVRDLGNQMRDVNSSIKDVSAYEKQTAAVQATTERIANFKAQIENAATSQKASAAAAAEYGEKIKAQKTQIAETESKLNTYESELKELQSEYAATGGSSDELRQKIADKEQQIKATTEELGRQNSRLEELQDKERKAAAETREHDNDLIKLNQSLEKSENTLGRQEAKLEATSARLKDAGVNTDDLSGSVETLQARYDELKTEQGAAANAAGTFGEKASSAISLVKQVLVATGIAKAVQEISKELIECAEMAIEFESAITGVYKTVEGTDEQLQAISDGVKELSLVIPATTTEIAGVAEAAGQLGIATDDVLNFSTVMTNLGVATNLSAEQAASSLAKFANITQMSAYEYENLGSVIVALGNNFATTEADIVNMATGIASAGELVGMSEANIMAFSATLSSLGMEAQAGSTSISKLIRQFETMVATGSDKLESFANVAGMTAGEFKTAWGEDAVSAIVAFISGLGELDASGGSSIAVLNELGITEERLTKTITALATSGDLLTSAVEMSNAAWEENTALTKEAELRYGTTESKIQMCKNAFTLLGITIGDKLLPVIGKGAEALGNFAIGINKLLGGTSSITEDIEKLNSSDLSGLIQQYYELRDAISDSGTNTEELADIEAQLIDVKKQIIEATGGVVTAAGLEDDAFEKLVNALKGYVDAADEVAVSAAIREAETAIISYGTNAAKANDAKANMISLNEKSTEMWGKEAQEAMTLAAEMESLNTKLKTLGDSCADDVFAEASKLLGENIYDMSSFNKALSNTKDNAKGYQNELKGINEDLSEQSDLYNESSDAMQDAIDKTMALVEAEVWTIDDAVAAWERMGYSSDIILEAYDEIAGAAEAATDANEVYANSFEYLIDIAGQYAEGISAAYASAETAAYSSLVGQASAFQAFEHDTKASADEAIENIRSYANAYREYNTYVNQALEAGLDPTAIEMFLGDVNADTIAVLKELGSEGGGELVSEFNSAVNELKAESGSLSNVIASMSPEFISSIETMMAEAGITAENGADDLLAKIAEAYRNNGDITTAELEALINDWATSGGANAETAGAETGEAYTEGVEGSISEGTASLGEAATNAVDGVTESTVPAAEEGGTETGQAYLNSTQETISEGAEQVSAAAYEELGNALSSVAELLINNLADSISGSEAMLANSFRETLAGSLEEVVSAMAELAASVGEATVLSMSEGVTGAAGELTEAETKTMTDSLKNSESATSSKAKTAGKSTVTDMAAGVRGNAAVLRSTLTSIISSGLSGAQSSTVGRARTVGSALISGIASGVSSSSGVLRSAMTSAVNNAVAAARAAAQINSPSKLFADEVGAYFPAGMAEGVLNAMGTLEDASAEMVRAGLASAEAAAREQEVLSVVGFSPAMFTQLAAQNYASVQSIDTRPVESLSANAFGGGEINLEINYNPTIYVDGDKPGDLESKLKSSNQDLVDKFNDLMKDWQFQNRRRGL